MSYILDALKKSDRERQQGRVPTLHTAPQPLVARRPKGMLVYSAASLILVALGVAIGWWRPWLADTAAAPPLVAAVPAPLHASPQKASRGEAPADRPAAPPSFPKDAAPAVRTPVVAAPPPVVAGATANPAPLPAADLGEPVEEASVPTLAELPMAIQQEIPRLAVLMHAYSSLPERRLVSVNDVVLREGETLRPGLILERITPEGMVFAFKGYRFRYSGTPSSAATH